MSTTLARATPADEVKSFLEMRAGDLAKVCDKHLKPETIIQIAILCTYKNPDILKCDRETIFASVVQASSLGFSLNPSSGEAYLVPYYNKETKSHECTLQVGYQGLTKLARESGQVNYVQARLVRESDEFRWTYTPDLSIAHSPDMGGKPGVITHCYAVAKLISGEIVGELMSIDELEYIRSKSRKPDGGPWASFTGEMYKKTALRRLCKSLPKTPRLVAALEVNDAEFHQGAFDSPAPRLAIDNQSGFAKGQYASREQADAFLEKMAGYLQKRNAQWLDRWAGDGNPPSGLKPELINKFQADNHLVKWGKATGRLNDAVDPDAKARQLGRYTAIIYHKSKAERIALTDELARYCDEQERLATDKLRRDHPDLFPDDLAADCEFDDLTEDNWEDGRE